MRWKGCCWRRPRALVPAACGSTVPLTQHRHPDPCQSCFQAEHCWGDPRSELEGARAQSRRGQPHRECPTQPPALCSSTGANHVCERNISLRQGFQGPQRCQRPHQVRIPPPMSLIEPLKCSLSRQGGLLNQRSLQGICPWGGLAPEEALAARRRGSLSQRGN